MTDYTRQEVVEKDSWDEQAAREVVKNELKEEFTQKELHSKLLSLMHEWSLEGVDPDPLKSPEQLWRE
jgi:hypothetical protein